MDSKVDRHGKLYIASEGDDWGFVAFDKHLPGVSSRGGLGGASANTFLLGAFLYHSRLKDTLDGNDLELPGGLASWKEICEVLYVTLPSMMTMSELASRVLVLVEELVSDEALHLQQSSSGIVGGEPKFLQALHAAAGARGRRRPSLESCNLVGGALAFTLEYLRGSHVFLSAHQLCEVKTMVYDVCSRLDVRLGSSTASGASRASRATPLPPPLPGIDSVRKDLAKLRNVITDIVSERSWIDVGCVPLRQSLAHHDFSPLSELSVSCSVAGPFRCQNGPFIAQVGA